MTIRFGNVPHPPFIDRLIPDAQTRAWDDLGPRKPVGVCQHSMVGSLWGTDGWFRRGGASTGLTDYGIGGATDGPEWDGVILRWNDPLGRAATVHLKDNEYVAVGTPGAKELSVSANRAGWANGGSDGLEGDGPLFVRTLGIAAINRHLVSIERSDGGDTSTPMSAKQFESVCALTAYWFDQAHVPWNAFPLNPAHGIVTHMLHYEFATKSCPHPPVTSRIDEIQNRVRQILKAAQTGSEQPAPVPPSNLVTVDHDSWPADYQLSLLNERFGRLIRHAPDGNERRFGFNPNGVISNAWAARCAAERLSVSQLPAARDWWTHPNGNDGHVDLIVFDRGWLLLRSAVDRAWRWVV